jgi:hypothetical protein
LPADEKVTQMENETSPAAVYSNACVGLLNQLATGARLIEVRDGHPPAMLMLGGTLVWIMCLSLMMAT